MDIQEIFNIGNGLTVAIQTAVQNEVLKAFQKIGEMFGSTEHKEFWNQPLRIIDCESDQESPANFDNLTTINFIDSSNQQNKENQKIMQRIKTIKNARIRHDGRYEWRKMIAGTCYQIIENNFELFYEKVRELKKELKKNANNSQKIKRQISLYQLAEQYYQRNIYSKVNKGTLKIASCTRYLDALRLLKKFNKSIYQYSKDDIIDFFNSVKIHRTGAYCFFLLKRIYADEFEKGNIKRNIIATLPNPFPVSRCSKKGMWLNVQEQQLLKANLDNSILSKEILFYLFTGCRLREAYETKVDFTKQVAIITRRKTENYGVQQTTIPLSSKFCELIKNDWPLMFKKDSKTLSKYIVRFLQRIGIKDKSTHDLRHTFSSNLYYLGVDPKRQQYLMGHSTIKQTYDTYTHLDMSVTKEEIINIWYDFYPQF